MRNLSLTYFTQLFSLRTPVVLFISTTVLCAASIISGSFDPEQTAALEKYLGEETNMMCGFRSSRPDIAEDLIMNGADPSVKGGKHEINALHLAAYYGRISVMEFLLKHNVDIHSTSKGVARGHDDENWTALFWAIYGNQKEAVRFLVENGANVEALTKRKNRPLHVAAREGHSQIIDLLVDLGATISATQGEFGFTPLSTAAFYNKSSSVIALINHGGEFEMKDASWGHSPIRWSAMHYAYNNETVEILAALGADTNFDYGWGTWEEDAHLVIVKHGKDKFIKNESALRRAIRLGYHGSQLDKVLAESHNDESIHEKDKKGVTIFDIALATRNQEALLFLLDNNADPMAGILDGVLVAQSVPEFQLPIWDGARWLPSIADRIIAATITRQ